MRSIKKVGVWPVGFASGKIAEHPIVRNGRIIGW